MNYPYRNNIDGLRAGNALLGGIEKCTVSEESLAYMLLLMGCDRLLAPYVMIGLSHIYASYREEMEEREGMMLRAVRYDRTGGGTAHQDYAVAEAYIERERRALEKAERKYRKQVLPVLKVHHALLHNAETMFGIRDPSTRVIRMAIANSMTIPMARMKTSAICSGIDDAHTWALIIRPKALARKNADGYLYFPDLSEEEIESLCQAGFQNLNDRTIRRYCLEEGICPCELEERKTADGRFDRDFSNSIRSRCLGWNTWPCVRQIASELPEIGRVLAIYGEYLDQTVYEAALRKKFQTMTV